MVTLRIVTTICIQITGSLINAQTMFKHNQSTSKRVFANLSTLRSLGNASANRALSKFTTPVVGSGVRKVPLPKTNSVHRIR